MKSQKRTKTPDTTLLGLAIMVVIGVAACLWKGGWHLPISALMRAGELMQSVWLRLLLGIILGGLIQVLIPASLMVKWMGPASGLKGILIGSYLGIAMVGGPYVQLPIILSIYKAGAGIGPVISLLTAGNLISLQHLLAWHITILGARIALARYVASIVFVPLVGLAGGAIYHTLSAFS